MSKFCKFAEVLLPVPFEGTFTYLVPENLIESIEVGRLVIVPFGAKKFYSGIVIELHDREQESIRIKKIVSSPGSGPIVCKVHLDFWKWIASYYMCTFGEVMKAALPSGFRLESENIEDLVAFRVKKITYVRLTPFYVEDHEKLHIAIEKTKRAKKQLDMLIAFTELSGIFNSADSYTEVSKMDLVDKSGSSSEILKSLCNKQILECYEKEVENEPIFSVKTEKAACLNHSQSLALDSIKKNFETHAVCLLHGYTSSGKTEIYTHLIDECIASGKQALFLVPEIALTTQLSDRLRKVFGSNLGVYHSGLSDNERLKVWSHVPGEDGLKVILGARSSVFLPFHSLGLVIVDEEHESSFKQQDPAPRYNARNAALVLASFFKAKTLLGTATPSIESYANCLMGKSGLTELFSRYMDTELPDVKIVNVKELKHKKRMKSIFSPLLEEKIDESLKSGGQAILFQNRRGYAPVMQCRNCGWIPKCERCDVSLTYHKSRNKICCHYCGFEIPVPEHCPACGEQAVVTSGFGTEQIEDEIKKLFPLAKTVRMDSDTTRTRHSFEKIIDDFEAGDTDILIGTQMVSKGLDFNNVKVAGIVNADQMLNFPDFRAHERAFQLMSQVSGRAGRSGQRGVVVIQTSQPENPVIGNVVSNDYISFFNGETYMRQMFGYPPYTRLINILLKHRDVFVVRKAALEFAKLAWPYFNDKLLGPDHPPVSRINRLYIQSLLLKINLSASASGAKDILFQIRDKVKQIPEFKSVQFVFDVDPV
jgi:primosomal protein N' (replication factor Y) (superfamily II helicase)